MNVPEFCKLTACWTGDGWQLAVQDGLHVIAYLQWPDAWPEEVTDRQLQDYGFEIV